MITDGDRASRLAAIDALRRARQLEPRVPDLERNLGTLLGRVGRYGEARLVYAADGFGAAAEDRDEPRTVHLGVDLFRAISRGDGWDAISDVGFSVTQPLMRGAGELVVTEDLTQAENDLIYATRDFEQLA